MSRRPGPPAGPRRVAAGLALLLTVAVSAACGPSGGLTRQTVTGAHGRGIIALLDASARPALLPGIADYVREKRTRVVSAGGSPSAIATSVKHGKVVDVIILPAGPDLDRVRDELVAPPVAVGRRGSTTYWAAPVTARSLGFLAYLRTPHAVALLRAHGLTG